MAQACLERIGYYRLSGYWYPFRKSHLSVHPLNGTPLINPLTGKQVLIVEDGFRFGSTFQQVMNLYVFDKRLRLIFLDAIERVEIALRVDMALLLGQRSPWAHRDPLQFNRDFGSRVNTTGQTVHQKWLGRLDDSYIKSKEEFVKHFKAKYPRDYPPIWIAVELWDFGMLSVMLEGLKHSDQSQLAKKYLLPRPELLTSLARNINNIRNICAHHSRLWNRSPADRLAPPRSGEIAVLDHLAVDLNARSRVYATAALLQYLLRIINPSTRWSQRLKDHMNTLPTTNGIELVQAGFPSGWDSLDLWK